MIRSRKAVAVALGTFLASTLVVAVSISSSPGSASATPSPQHSNSNAPWFPSLNAFESFDSGRSHVFSDAYFGGSEHRANTVTSQSSPEHQYPSAYNMVYKDAQHVYIYGGSYGDVPGSIGAFVAQVDPTTLQPIWYTQLMNITTGPDAGTWDYPGVMGLLKDGNIYVTYSDKLAKVNPGTGAVLATLELPHPGAAATDTSFNGFDATPNGTIILKSLYRTAGCTKQGPNALSCSGPVPPSVIVSVNSSTMTVDDTVQLTQPAGARPTIAQFNGKTYYYLVEGSFYGDAYPVRYSISSTGQFTFDTSWKAANVNPIAGESATTSLGVFGNWMVIQNNSLRSHVPLTVTAISQADGSVAASLQPFANIPIDPTYAAALGATSWAPAAVAADVSTGRIYVFDTAARLVDALKLTVTNGKPSLSVVWSMPDTTTEFMLLIGSPEHRVLVTTDIPTSQTPGANSTDSIVWRSAATGAVLATSAQLPAMTQGTQIQPFYNGNVFWEGEMGTLSLVAPRASHPSEGADRS